MSNKRKLFAAFFSMFFFISAARTFSDELNIPLLDTDALIESCRVLLLEKSVPVAFDTKMQSLCFTGQINKKSSSPAIEILKSKTVKQLVITSVGGSVHYALDMAKYIQKNNIDIVVNHYCVSSCANYFFLAARQKYVPKDSFVGWHGGPGKDLKKVRKDVKKIRKKELKENPNTVFNETLAKSMKIRKKDLERQRKLLEQASVYDGLLYISMTAKQADYYSRTATENNQPMIYVPSPEDLSEHYGVKGLVDMWHPGNQATLNQYVTEKKEEAKNNQGWFVFDVYLYTFPPDSW